ncbi:hypothetical protein SDC9_138398 [bioreactor metagenome]|uniref:Uncharacterized protein n=1 Tax=bioreactor metagenome TaxID=1076179 RepID=A0A645DP69_9ZZZZ
MQPGRAVGHRRAVAQMIVSHHGEAPPRQIRRKVPIAQDIFRNPMGNLQHGPGRSFRQPLHRVQISFSVSRKEGKFAFLHGGTPLSVL